MALKIKLVTNWQYSRERSRPAEPTRTREESCMHGAASWTYVHNSSEGFWEMT